MAASSSEQRQNAGEMAAAVALNPPTGTKCGKYGGKCGKNKNAMAFEYCSVWYHTGCVNITDEIYELLETLEQSHWFCKKCHPKAFDVLCVVKNVVQKKQ